jgi:hypothetical protein
MRAYPRVLLVASLLVAPATSLLAQTAVDPSGHWEGTIQLPDMSVNVEIDLTKNGKGELAGTFSQPAQSVKGLPLSTVAVESRTVRFVVKGGAEPATFEGALSVDGHSLTGNIAQSGASLPLNLTRTGDARIAPAPKNAAIGKELEGIWNGALDLGGRQMRIVLKMSNQPDGTATGTIVSADGSGVEIPIGMTQKGSNLTIEVASVGASYVGVLNETGTELAGTWTQGLGSLPLTFRRAGAESKQ